MLFLLDASVRTVKWNGIPLHEANSAIVKEETNGDFYLTVRYPITDSGIYQLIKEDMLIKAPVPVLGAQLFRIKKPIENDDSLDITAYHVSDDIMQRSITPVSVVGQSCTMALSQMVQNAKTGLGDFSFTSDIMDSRTFNTTETETLYSILMDGKHSIVGTWEGELVRDNFALSIKRSRGADRGVVITTHKNLKSYQRTKNSQGVVTRIHARSTFKPDDAKDEVTLRVTVDSPLINSYPYINEKEYENNNAETAEDLRKWAKAKFTNEGIDKVSDAIEIEAYELDGQVVHLGDTVNLKSRKHSADLYKKAIAYEFNALTEEYISITFDDKPGVGGSGVSSGLSNAADTILGASATAQEIAVQRAVKNANAAFDAEFDKRQDAIDDAIEQAKADAEEYADKLKTEISQEFDTFDKEYQANKKSQDQQIADILAKAQTNTNLATEAKSIGSQAKVDAANALSRALQYKNEAISEANMLVEAAKGGLSGQISNLSTDINQTKESIQMLATKATVDTLTNRVSHNESSLQIQAGQILERLTKSEVNTLVEMKGYQTANQVQTIVTRTAGEVRQTISEVEAKIPTYIGNVNLLLNTATLPLGNRNNGTWQSVSGGNGTASVVEMSDFPHGGIQKGIRVVNNTNGGNKDLSQFVNLTIGEKYTISTWARVSSQSSTDSVTLLMRSWANNTDSNRILSTSISNKYWVRYSITFTADTELNSIQFGQRGNGIIELCGLKLERGSVATDWETPPEEFTTVKAFNEVIDTVNSHTRTISEQGQSISQTIQTSQGLLNRVQLLADAQNLVYDPTRYSKYVARNSTSSPKLSVYSQYSAMRINHSGLTSDQYNGFKLPLRTSTFTSGEKLSIRTVIGIDAIPDSGGEIKFEIKRSNTIIAQFKIKPTKTGSNQIFTATTTVNVSTSTVDDYGLDILINRNGNVNITQISIIRGDTPPTSFVDNTTSQDIAIATQVSQLAGSYVIQNINSAGDLINGINLGADGNNRIIGKATRITGDTIIDNAVIKSAMVDKLKTANFEAGSVTTTILGAEAVTSEKLKVDQGFFDKLMANDAYLQQLFAKSAFITQVQSVTLSASKISGGNLKATNGAMEIQMNNGQILYYTSNAAMKRVLSGYPTQFVKFSTGNYIHNAAYYKSGVTIIGSDRNGGENSDGGSFAGVRIWNGKSGTKEIDALDLVGDITKLVASAYDSPQGFQIMTWNDGGAPKITTLGSNNQKRDARLEIGDIWLHYDSTGRAVSLKVVLDNIFLNFRKLNASGAFGTQTSYHSHWN